MASTVEGSYSRVIPIVEYYVSHPGGWSPGWLWKQTHRPPKQSNNPGNKTPVLDRCRQRGIWFGQPKRPEALGAGAGWNSTNPNGGEQDIALDN